MIVEADNRHDPRFLVEKFIAPLRLHSNFIIVFIVSASLSALLLTYAYNDLYKGESTIFFKPLVYPKLNVQQTEALGSPVPTAPFKVIGQTLAALVKSEDLLRSVVIELQLQQKPDDSSAAWYIKFYRRSKDYIVDIAANTWSLLKYGRILNEDAVMQAVRELIKNTKIEHEDSYVFLIKSAYRNPQTAAAIVNSIAAHLIDNLREAERSQALAENKELSRLLALKSEEIKSLDRRLKDILIQNKIGAFPQEIDQATRRLSELELTRDRSEAQLRQEVARLNDLYTKVGSDNGKLEGRINPGLPYLRQNYTKFTNDKYSTELSVVGLTEYQKNLEKSINNLKNYLKELAELQVDFDVIANDLANAKRDFALLTGAIQETIIRQTTATFLRVQEKALPSELPSSPIKIYHVGLAAFLAAVVSMGLSYLLSYLKIEYFSNAQTSIVSQTKNEDKNKAKINDK